MICPAIGLLADVRRTLAGVVTEADTRLADGRTLHAYDTGADRIASSPGAPDSPVAVFWLHGSSNVGSPAEPLFAAAEANGLRWVSYDRPGYGGSGPHDGRLARPSSRVTRDSSRTPWPAPGRGGSGWMPSAFRS
jgi:pimeloyl-ACP methyl ester carboxylesterase